MTTEQRFDIRKLLSDMGVTCFYSYAHENGNIHPNHGYAEFQNRPPTIEEQDKFDRLYGPTSENPAPYTQIMLGPTYFNGKPTGANLLCWDLDNKPAINEYLDAMKKLTNYQGELTLEILTSMSGFLVEVSNDGNRAHIYMITEGEQLKSRELVPYNGKEDEIVPMIEIFSTSKHLVTIGKDTYRLLGDPSQFTNNLTSYRVADLEKLVDFIEHKYEDEYSKTSYSIEEYNFVNRYADKNDEYYLDLKEKIQGYRNNTLRPIFTKHIQDHWGQPKDELTRWALRYNDRNCQVPLDKNEIVALIHSRIKYVGSLIEVKKRNRLTEEQIDSSIDTMVKEAEHDRIQIEQTLVGMSSTFTKIGMPHVVNSKKAGAGKSYILNTVAEYFPEENVILLAGASAKAILHRNGTMVIKNEKTGELEEVEPIISNLEDELEKLENVEKKTPENKSRIKDIEKEIRTIRKLQKKLINLENKIIIIQDTPQDAVIVNIISLLSQDSKRDQEYSFNDIVGGKITPSANIFRGMPVLFTTRVIDDTRNTRFEEINRRHINITPNVSKEKIDSAVRLIVKGCSLLPEEYDEQVVSSKDKEQAKIIISKIAKNLMNHTKDLKAKESGVRILFDDAIYNSIPTSQENVWSMTVASRLTRYVSVITLIYMDSRPRLVNTQTGRTWIIPTYKDLKKALELMESATSEVRPYIAQWYNSVFKPLYDEHEKNNTVDSSTTYRKNRDGEEYPETTTEDRVALTTELLKVRTSEVLGIPKPSTGEMLKNYLYPLMNQGIIDHIQSKIDKRAKIYFPADENQNISSLFASSNDFRLEVKEKEFYPTKEAIKQVVDSILDRNIEKSIAENITPDTLLKNKIYKLVDPDGIEITSQELVDKYLFNPETCFRDSNITSDTEEEQEN